MKLPKTAWKNAWHDRKLSDQFFREWGKLDKSPVHELQSSGAWMGQIAIEVGQLAQSMIHLEETAVHPAHLRLAQDMAIKLAVHAAKLASALTIAVSEEDDAFSNVVRKTAQAVDTHGEPPPAAERKPSASPVTHRGASHLPPLPGKFAPQSAAPATPSPAVPHEAATHHATAAAVALAPAPVADELPEYRRERPMEQTIVSLYGRGLSVEEIELVTGQPPSLIESILKANPA